MRKFVKAALFAGAAWSAMAGMAAAQDAPTTEDAAGAAKEGWIALPTGSLDDLDPVTS